MITDREIIDELKAFKPYEDLFMELVQSGEILDPILERTLEVCGIQVTFRYGLFSDIPGLECGPGKPNKSGAEFESELRQVAENFRNQTVVEEKLKLMRGFREGFEMAAAEHGTKH